MRSSSVYSEACSCQLGPALIPARAPEREAAAGFVPRPNRTAERRDFDERHPLILGVLAEAQRIRAVEPMQ